MKVVVDTNVIVSGLLSPFGPPGKIVQMITIGDLILCLDARIILEYKEVLSRKKFDFNQSQVGIFLDQIEFKGEIISSKLLEIKLPDRNDEMFLEVALAGKAKYLITGNIKHFPANKYKGVKIINPTNFFHL